MICVCRIETFHVEGNIGQVVSQLPLPVGVLDKGVDFDMLDMMIEKEMVVGKIYKNFFGEEVCIGMTEQVQGAIGLPFEALDNVRRKADIRIEKIRSESAAKIKNAQEVANAKAELKMNSMGLWDRVVFLFTDAEERLEKFWGGLE